MVRTFCDRCGRVIAGASKLGGATVRAADEHGNEIIKLDFCAFCADWAVNKLLRKALTERHEDEQAGEHAMDKLEFDLTAGKLREKETSSEKEAPESERIGWTAKKARGTAAENHCCDEECERSHCDKETAADEPAAPKLPTVRLFISQPMRGKSDEEIESEREDLIAIAKAVYAGRGEVEVIDSFFKGGLDVPAGAKAPLYYLSKSLELLATADVAIFAKDWREARGCRIEHECTDGYGVARIELPVEG